MTAAAIARAVRTANELQRRQACATCGELRAPFACAWRCEVPTPVAAWKVRVGEALITPKSKRTARVLAVKFRTSESDWGTIVWGGTITVEYRHGRRKPPYPQFTYHRPGKAEMTVLRPGVCSARCCERHAREVGDGVYHCRAHWRAWMEAASA